MVKYEFTVTDIFAILGGSGGHNVTVTLCEYIVDYPPDYISVQNFITLN